MSIIREQRRTKITDFWNFCAERERVYFNKEGGQPRPWTSDPVLDSYFFCNAIRAWDTGTKYLLAQKDELTFAEWVFHVLLYRTFNLIGTHTDIVKAHGLNFPIDSLLWRLTAINFDVATAEKVLRIRRQKGQKVFTGAFMTAGIVNAAKKITGEDNGDVALIYYIDYLRRSWLPYFVLRCEETPQTLESIYDKWLELHGFGRFLAYQVALDTGYKLNVSEDEFTVMGPGAEAGLKILYPQMGGTPDEMLTHIRDLASTQPSSMLERLSLCNIEHSLCEFTKYERVRTSVGSTRKYTPGVAR